MTLASSITTRPGAAVAATLALAGALVIAPAASAQRHLPADPVFCDPASNPNDAVRVAPEEHQVVFEDSHVRVLQIVLPPGAIEPVHIHALPSVITGDTGGGAGAKFLYMTFEFRDGRFVELQRNEVSPTPGYRTVWSAPEGPHAIANIGPVPVTFMRMEIKPENCAK